MKLFLAMAVAFICFQSCASSAPDPSEPYRADLLRGLGASPFEPSVPGPGGTNAGFYPEGGAAVSEYRRRLKQKSSWNSVAVWHQMGMIPCRGTSGTRYSLGVSLYLPPAPRGTFLFVHGYLSYGGNFSWLLDQMVSQGWAVVTLDLPGHGFSTGLRSDIADFRDYGDAVAALMDWANRQTSLLPRPWILAGHSLGGGSILELMGREPTVDPDLVVLAAPLVHTVAFDASQFGYLLIGGVVKTLPPMFTPDEYLGGATFPTHWFKAVADWNQGLGQVQFKPWPVLLLQGTKDGVVDAGYNLPFLEKKLKNLEVKKIENFSHNLLESDHEKDVSLELLVQDLKARGLWK